MKDGTYNFELESADVEVVVVGLTDDVIDNFNRLVAEGKRSTYERRKRHEQTAY